MNYYPFHIGDYASATRHLSWDEDAAYRRLLDVYYSTEKPLPIELRAVFRLVVASTEVQREAVETILREFFDETPEGWINSRADEELTAMRGKQQKQRDKANKRWNKPRTEPGTASAMPRHSELDTTASKNDADAMPPTPTPTPTPTPVEKKERVRASAALRPDGVPESVWSDFMAQRKAHRAPLTQTALDGIARQAGIAGMTLAEALAHCCSKGWRSFEAAWVRPDGTAQPRASPAAAKRTAFMDSIYGRTQQQPENVIDADFRTVTPRLG